MAKVKGRGKVGDVVRIDLGNGNFAYGRTLASPLMAFYDLQSKMPVEAVDVVRAPILFTIWVMKCAIKSPKWEIVGNIPPSEDLMTSPKFFKMDMIDRNFYIYENDQFNPVSREACIGLEPAAAWDPEHIEDRLRDHFAGVPNKWVESLKLPEA
jgi:hypothetical protein